MYIDRVRLLNIRCFDDTGDIELGSGCNLFIGANNAGKSTILKAMLSLQGASFAGSDLRPSGGDCGYAIGLSNVSDQDRKYFSAYIPDGSQLLLTTSFRQDFRWRAEGRPVVDRGSSPVLHVQWPLNTIIPVLARRMTAQFSHSVDQGAQVQRDGTFGNLYAKIDRLAGSGHPQNATYREAVTRVSGLHVTTASSPQGKQAGVYLDAETFITLDQMGDGITEMVGLIVDLCVERGKIFILEEPETHLHPRGLKALLDLIKTSAAHNQFVIATHSNIVMRELGAMPDSRIFRVWRDGEGPMVPSRVEMVGESAGDRVDVLRELGYEFADLGLHDGWLFLEEASAETVFNEVLIPIFARSLQGRLRTYSSAGADQLATRVDSFSSLVTFVHLEPAYRGRVWVRADNDPAGQNAIADLRQRIDWLDEETCATFQHHAFERFYPSRFETEANAALSNADKKARREAKRALLQQVISWGRENPEDARREWEASAEEPIRLLRSIEGRLLHRST